MMSPFNEFNDQICELMFGIEFDEINLLEVVGKGTFGVVRRGFWKNSIEVAVKLIETEAERKAFQVELRQLSRINHPNIVKLYGATNNPVALVMEYAEGGSLYNVLHSTTVGYTLSHAISWVLQCARGVSYMHSMQPKPLVHRDLKPPNLLLVNGGKTLKICDFGTACDIHTHMTNNKGSAAWMAPEVFESINYTEKCDVFSWALIFWEVLSRKKPFDEIGGPAFRIMWAVHSGQRPPLLRNCPKVIEQLMTKCWLKEPEDRPSMIEVEQKVEQIFKYCGDEANEPIENTHYDYYTSQDSMSSSNYSNDHQMQTQLDAQQHIVTEPPKPNLSSTNNNFILSRIDPALSVPPNMSGYSPLNSQLVNNSQYVQKRMQNQIPRRSSEINNQINTPLSSNSHSSRKGHKRSSSSGTPIVLTNANATNLSQISSKSRSIVNLMDDMSINYSQPHIAGPSHAPSHAPLQIPVQNPSQNPRYALPHLNVPPVPLRNPNQNRISESMSPNIEPLHLEFDAYLVLESKLHPIPPEYNDRESVDLFNQHRLLSQDYLKKQMEVTLLMERKHELLTDENRNITNSFEQYWELKDEQESLLQLRNNLIKQLNIIKRKRRQKEAAADGDWILVDQSDTQTSNG